MAAPVKLSMEPEGDSPELVAWGLMDWVKRVETIDNRVALLGAYHACLAAAKVGLGHDDAGGAAGGVHRRLAYKLTHMIAEMEGRELGLRNQGDRTWILATYAECLEAVLGKRVAVAAAVDNAAELCPAN